MQLNPILRPYISRPLLAGTVGFGLFAHICGILFAWSLSQMVSQVHLYGFSISAQKVSLWVLVFLALARMILNIGQAKLSTQLARHAKSKIRLRLLEQEALDPTPLMRGVEALDPWYSQYLPQLFLAALAPFIILCISFSLDLLSGLVFLISAPLLPIFLALIGLGARVKQQKQWKLLLQQGNLYRETLLGLTTLKLFGISKDWGLKLAQSAETLRSTTLGILRIAFLSALVLELVGTLGTAILAVQLGIRLLHGNIDYSLALFLLLLAPEFYLPLRQLGLRAHAAMEGDAAAQSLFPKQTIIHNTIPSLSPNSSHLLTIENLSAHWPQQEKNAFENCSFTISATDFLGISGPSGCGKSTLLACILGIIAPSSGKIQIRQGLRILWIPQSPQIYHRSLRDNVLQYPQSSEQYDQEIWKALDKVGLGKFVRDLPLGLNTSVGSGGARLSGGQLRRLALARAFVSPCDLILMDEPDAHLDSESLDNLEDLLCSMDTVARILVTHQEQSLSKAQRILRMGNPC